MNKKSIKNTIDDLKYIYGDDNDFFQKEILSNCFCAKCPNSKYNSTIINYKIFINDMNDIILEGFCADCGGSVGRYLETGEVGDYLKRIKEVRRLFLNVGGNRGATCVKIAQVQNEGN